MPRQPRIAATGAVHHLISRIHNGEFRIHGMRERREYLRRLGRAITATDWRMLGYGLMDNHTHVAGKKRNDPQSRLMHPLNVGFAQWLNRDQDRHGPVFRDRFRDVLYEPELTAWVLAYMHNNPVRAGVVVDPADSTWTSHRAYIGLAKPPPWLDVEWGLAQAGFDSSPSGRMAFHSYVVSVSGEARQEALSDEDRDRIRARIRRSVGATVDTASVVGKAGDRVVLVGAAGTELRPRWPGQPLEALQQVGRHLGYAVANIRSGSRVHTATRARRLALLLWCRFLHRPASEMARFLGLSATGASQLLHRKPALRLALEDDARALAAECWRAVHTLTAPAAERSTESTRRRKKGK